MPEELQEHIAVQSMADLFEVLDVDGSGQVDKDEFTEGFLNLCLPEDNEQQTILMLKLMRATRKTHRDLDELLHKICRDQKNIRASMVYVTEAVRNSSASILPNGIRHGRFSGHKC